MDVTRAAGTGIPHLSCECPTHEWQVAYTPQGWLVPGLEFHNQSYSWPPVDFHLGECEPCPVCISVLRPDQQLNADRLKSSVMPRRQARARRPGSASLSCSSEENIIAIRESGFSARTRKAPRNDRDTELLRSELFSIEQLKRHAAMLAGQHRIDPRPGPDRLLPRLADNARVLLAAYDVVTVAATQGCGSCR